MVESFRQWGIYPRGMRSTSVEALLWPTGEQAVEESGAPAAGADVHSLFQQKPEQWFVDKPQPWFSDYPKSRFGKRFEELKAAGFQPWNLESNRFEVWQGADKNGLLLWAWLMSKGENLLPALGLVVDPGAPPTVFRSRTTKLPSVEVHSVRTALRRSPRGATVTDLVVEITQRRRGYFDEDQQRKTDALGREPDDDGDFRYRAGCTVLIDPLSMRLRRVIRTPGAVNDDRHLARVRRFLTDGGIEPDNTFWLTRNALNEREPFALLHRHSGDA